MGNRKTGIDNDAFYFGEGDLDRLKFFAGKSNLSLVLKKELTAILNKMPEDYIKWATKIVLEGEHTGAVGEDVGGNDPLNIEIKNGSMAKDACIEVAEKDLLSIFELEELVK